MNVSANIGNHFPCVTCNYTLHLIPQLWRTIISFVSVNFYSFELCSTWYPQKVFIYYICSIYYFALKPYSIFPIQHPVFSLRFSHSCSIQRCSFWILWGKINLFTLFYYSMRSLIQCVQKVFKPVYEKTKLGFSWRAFCFIQHSHLRWKSIYMAVHKRQFYCQWL